jgi:hypothetical protein
MTLDHLRITNLVFTDIIRSLLCGAVPDGVASTAAVKPSSDASGAVLKEYEESCSELRKVVSDGNCFTTGVKFAHPWFGLMDAGGWHLLAGIHMGIHRKQLETIIENARQ